MRERQADWMGLRRQETLGQLEDKQIIRLVAQESEENAPGRGQGVGGLVEGE